MLSLVVVERQGARHRDARPDHRQNRIARRRRGGAGHRRLRQRLLPFHQCARIQLHRHLARVQTRSRVRQPLLHADPSHLHSGFGRLPIQAHADERIAAQRRPHLGAAPRRATNVLRIEIPESERDYYLERRYPSFGNLVPRDVASRNAKAVCDEGRGVGETGLGVYLDFPDAIQRAGRRSDPRTLRQSVRHVRAHHRRGSVPGSDAHLPGHPLHHGRPVGGLPTDEHHPGPVRDRRSQFLRPRRQPPGRQRAHARAGRRLLHPALHHRQLSGGHETRKGSDRLRRVQARRVRGGGHDQAAARDPRANARSLRFIANWAS